MLELDCLVWIICFPCSVTSSLAFGTVLIAQRLKINDPKLEQRGVKCKRLIFVPLGGHFDVILIYEVF